MACECVPSLPVLCSLDGILLNDAVVDDDD